MKCRVIILSIIVFSARMAIAQDSTKTTTSGDTLMFAGQASVWMNYNESEIPLWFGARYIPQLNYSINTPSNQLFDFEASLNINGSAGIHPFDSTYTDGSFRAYRLWARYSTQQFELRAGLQKINFGSASMLRPLMWFEQVDPRDPLRITTGVWGLLGRYYFLNNANIWLWTLYNNRDPKTWEIGKTGQKYPEFGGRFQAPFAKGEGGISFHHRQADTKDLDPSIPSYESIPENRIAFDGKWDYGVGIWTEIVWINKGKDVGAITNQEIINVGTDYTFGIGNGLNATFEQLFISYDKKAFEFSQPTYFSALSLSYPVGLSDTFNAIVYYDWTTSASYNFINWKRQFNKFYLYLMAYWNPDTYNLPQQQGSGGNMFAGKGVQLMFVYNH